MQLSNGPALLHALTPSTYVTLRCFLRQAKLHWASWRRRQRLAEDIGAYPVRSTEKLRFADTDCNGQVSNVGLAVCCQNARMEILSDPSRAPVPDGAHFVIARSQLDFLAEMRWPGSVELGTRVAHVGPSSIVLVRGLLLKGRCVACAKFIVVLIDATTRRAIQLPPVLIDALYEIGQHGLHNRFSVNFRLGNVIKGILVRL